MIYCISFSILKPFAFLKYWKFCINLISVLLTQFTPAYLRYPCYIRFYSRISTCKNKARIH